MNESLTWLRDPATGPALPDLMCGLIRDIRMILVHPDLANAAKLVAITQAVDQMAPPPGTQPAGAQAAASVVALLAHGTGPATLLFEELAGEPVRIDLTGNADRLLTLTECLELNVRPGTAGHQRNGILRAVSSGMMAAEVSSLVVPDRLPPAARRTLGMPGPDDPAPPPSTVPLGKVLHDLGVRREPLGAHVVSGTANASGSRILVEASARMWLGDVPVALASERVTAEFCQHSGRRPARSGGGTAPGLRAS
ncbi:MAG TPA: hypothetical protein VGG16_11715 [Streptosporangiaceae bacterium]|jgi:hypothetical protein